jgi:hypothetical protein
MATLVKNFAEILKEIPAGAWVAISERQHRTIAFGADARSVLRQAREMGEQIPLMVRVSESR